MGPDHLSAPRASPDLTATRRAGSSYWSRYCSRFSWWWWWLSACVTKISGSTSYLSHTRSLFSHFPQQEDGQYNVRGLSSDRRQLFSGCVLVGMFSASPSKVPWATFGCIDRFPFCFFSAAASKHIYCPEACSCRYFWKRMTSFDIIFTNIYRQWVIFTSIYLVNRFYLCLPCEMMSIWTHIFSAIGCNLFTREWKSFSCMTLKRTVQQSPTKNNVVFCRKTWILNPYRHFGGDPRAVCPLAREVVRSIGLLFKQSSASQGHIVKGDPVSLLK